MLILAMKEMLGEKHRQGRYGCDQGSAPFYTRLASMIPKTLKTYHKHLARTIRVSDDALSELGSRFGEKKICTFAPW
jgi:hypothetical protein